MTKPDKRVEVLADAFHMLWEGKAKMSRNMMGRTCKDAGTVLAQALIDSGVMDEIRCTTRFVFQDKDCGTCQNCRHNAAAKGWVHE